MIRARAAVRAAGGNAALAASKLAARLARVPATAVDVGLAGTLLAAMVTVRLIVGPPLGDRFPAVLVLYVVIAGCLVARRRAPLAAYLVGTAGLIIEALWDGGGIVSPYANLIGLYSLGLYASRRKARLGPLLVPLGLLGYYAPQDDVSGAAPAGTLFFWLLAWAAGYSNARRREQMEANRRLMRRGAIVEERVRIARELHDVIGHAVSTMLVQAGAGRMVLDTDPGRTRELLVSVEATGRSALAELDQVLGALRADDEAQPGLDDLDALVQPLVDTGMKVTIQIDPEVQNLPRSLELSAYRIVQEALTNALRHGRARAAEVAIKSAGGTVVIEVRDDGRGPAPGYQPGRGLLGITERVGLFGGLVEYGQGPRTGFVLRAELPEP